jgi:hypothetical protein
MLLAFCLSAIREIIYLELEKQTLNDLVFEHKKKQIDKWVERLSVKLK